jgi:hypothetical protein
VLKLPAASALLMAGLGICATSSLANDSSEKSPTDMLAGSPTASVLAQTNPPGPSEKGWSNDFHLLGFRGAKDTDAIRCGEKFGFATADSFF